jgi:hypothetical protein
MVEVASMPDEKGRILLNRTHEKRFTADPRNPPNCRFSARRRFKSSS